MIYTRPMAPAAMGGSGLQRDVSLTGAPLRREARASGARRMLMAPAGRSASGAGSRLSAHQRRVAPMSLETLETGVDARWPPPSWSLVSSGRRVSMPPDGSAAGNQEAPRAAGGSRPEDARCSCLLHATSRAIFAKAPRGAPGARRVVLSADMSQRHASLRPPRLCPPLCLPPRQSGLGWLVPATRVSSASAALSTTLPASAAKWSRLACPSDTRLFGLRGSVHHSACLRGKVVSAGLSQRHASLQPPRLCPLCLPPRQSGLGWHVPATRVSSASAALSTTLPASAAKWSRLACPSDTRLFSLRGSVHSACLRGKVVSAGMSQRHASLRPPRLCPPLCLPPRQSGLGWLVPATRVSSASAALSTTLPASAAKWSRLACPSDTRLFGLRGSVLSASAAKWSRLSLAARCPLGRDVAASDGGDTARRCGSGGDDDTRHRRRQRRRTGPGWR